MSITSMRSGAVLRALPLLAATAVALAAVPTASATLELGSRGPAVKRLNARLATLTYLPADRVGSRFTRATRYSVMAFQKYARLQVDGIVGPATTSALREAQRPTATAPAGSGRRIAVSLSRQLAFLVGRGGRVRRTLSVSTARPGTGRRAARSASIAVIRVRGRTPTVFGFPGRRSSTAGTHCTGTDPCPPTQRATAASACPCRSLPAPTASRRSERRSA